LSADNVRLKGRTSASSLASDASATSSATDFLAQTSAKNHASGNIQSSQNC
jgi:hypothetical protein